MMLRRKLKTFRQMSGAHRRQVCEAMVMLALARLVLVTVPFRLIVPWLSRVPETGACDDAVLSGVRRAVTTAARNAPWDAVCLPQAMAASAMLARRGCGSSLHLGATLDAQRAIVAHAWLTVGDTVVVGAAGIGTVTPLARFG